MYVEKISCPHCNELIWVNVPDGKKIIEIGTVFFLGQDAKQNCNKCGKVVLIRYDR